MSILLRSLLRLKGGHGHRAFEKATHEPEAVQAALLAQILEQNRETCYGRDYGFADIRSADAFSREVPVVSFAQVSPLVERMKAGDEHILTADKPVMFNVTSGTTASPKYVPLTREGVRVTARRSREWLTRALRDHPTFLHSATLCIAGASVEGTTPGGIPYGSASGMMYESMPGILHRSFALPFSVSHIGDHDLRYYVMARMALARDVSFVVTPNPGTLVRLSETGIRWQERIIQSIRDGVLSAGIPFHPGAADAQILGQLDAGLKPDRARAAALESVMRRCGRLEPSACWPNLGLLGCWLGSTIGMRAQELDTFFGTRVPRRDIGLLASEGCVTIPDQDDTPAGILALHNNYYEFIPVGDGHDGGRQPLRSHELAQGQQYRLILTNQNGLYRYDIDDIVEVQGFYNRTPVMAFIRKGDDVINITGEKLHVNHVMHAVRALQTVDLTVAAYRVAPNYNTRRHEFMLQLRTDLDAEMLRSRLLPLLDRALSDTNIEYHAKRASGRLHAPVLHLMDERWVEDDRRHAIRSGQREVQYKWRPMVSRMSDLDAQHVQRTISPGGDVAHA